MPPYDASGSGWLLVLGLMVPCMGILAILGLGVRQAERIAAVVFPATLVLALAIAGQVVQSGAAVTYVLGGWQPPLGIVLRADGTSAVLMLMTALVMGAVGLFARRQFATPGGSADARQPMVFWVMAMGVWAGLNAVFMAQDLFSLFVALELLTFSAVPLVCLDGRAETLTAALRYLLFALVGSVLYLLGTGLLYGAYGTLDFGLLRAAVHPDPATSLALGLMIAGLMAKAALFPLHLWLPPAHAGAPAAASAILSALVVKAPFFIILRLWFDLGPVADNRGAAQALAALGGASIIFCSIMALRQARLKLMIAYSTVAQIGYLFLVFPLVIDDATPAWQTIGWTGAVLQLTSHALAKAAMFMAVGLITETLGHDRIDRLGGAVQVAPISIAAFALGGLSLMGLPPSGGFVAKLMLLTAAVTTANWWIAATILAGGLLAGGYVLRVLGQALAPPPEGFAVKARVARHREVTVLVLALCAVALGFVPLQPFAILAIGRGILP
jgi:formate hydrogenlyase subunit 3/multisubunit Na+/H+ antiporter MnhD subunit